MSDSQEEAQDYIHGNSPEERRRLSLLNDILNDACLKALDPQVGESVVDFGSGLGQFTRLIARTVGRSGSVIGVEREPEQIAQAVRLAEDDDEAALVEFRNGDVLKPPLSDKEYGTFDVAHARFLLEHVPNPERVVVQMARVLRPGGRMFIVDDDHGNFHPWPEPEGFQPLWAAYVGSFKRLGNDPNVGRRLVQLIHAAGLTPTRNNMVFFGGCAGTDRFRAIADNLISALAGASGTIISGELLDQRGIDAGLKGLEKWKADPAAALWYGACSAEGIVPA